jgi:hypothetical protein
VPIGFRLPGRPFVAGGDVETAARFPLLHTHNYVIAPHTIIRGAPIRPTQLMPLKLFIPARRCNGSLQDRGWGACSFYEE